MYARVKSQWTCTWNVCSSRGVNSTPGETVSKHWTPGSGVPRGGQERVHSCKWDSELILVLVINDCTIYLYYNCPPTLAHPCMLNYPEGSIQRSAAYSETSWKMGLRSGHAERYVRIKQTQQKERRLGRAVVEAVLWLSQQTSISWKFLSEVKQSGPATPSNTKLAKKVQRGQREWTVDINNLERELC